MESKNILTASEYNRQIILLEGLQKEYQRIDSEIKVILADEKAILARKNANISELNRIYHRYADILTDCWKSILSDLRNKYTRGYYEDLKAKSLKARKEYDSAEEALRKVKNNVQIWENKLYGFEKAHKEWIDICAAEYFNTNVLKWAIYSNVRVKVSHTNVVLAPGRKLPGVYPVNAERLPDTFFNRTYRLLHPVKYLAVKQALAKLPNAWEKFTEETRAVEKASKGIGYLYAFSHNSKDKMVNDATARLNQASRNLSQITESLSKADIEVRWLNLSANGEKPQNLNVPTEEIKKLNLMPRFYNSTKNTLGESMAKELTSQTVSINAVLGMTGQEQSYNGESEKVRALRAKLESCRSRIKTTEKLLTEMHCQFVSEYPALCAMFINSDFVNKITWNDIKKSQKKHKTMPFLVGSRGTNVSNSLVDWMATDVNDRMNYNLRPLDNNYNDMNLGDLFCRVASAILGNFTPGFAKITVVDIPTKGYHKRMFDKLVESGIVSAIINVSELSEKIRLLEQKQKMIYDKYADALDEYSNPNKKIDPDYEILFIIGSDQLQCSDQLLNIISKGPRFGIFVFGVPLAKNLPKEEHFGNKCVSAYLSDLRIDTHEPNREHVETLIKEISESTADDYRKRMKGSVYWSEIDDRVKSFGKRLSQRIWDDSSCGLEVPIGLDSEAKVDVFRFNNDQFLSLIIGNTGSGKSVFLHTLITNMMLKYSPEQVQLHLMDFKDQGIEFSDYVGSPHVKNLLLDGTDKDMAVSILDDILKLKEDRNKILKENNCKDIYTYNAKHRDNPLPFHILVVDECHKLFAQTTRSKASERISDAIENIAREGRSAGIGFIMATQTLEGVDMPKAVLAQLNNAYMLSCNSNDADRIFRSMESSGHPTSIPAYHVFHISVNNKENIRKPILSKVFNIINENSGQSYTTILREQSFKSKNQFCYSGSMQIPLTEGIVRRSYERSATGKRNPIISIGYRLVVDLDNANIPVKFNTNPKMHLLVSGINSSGQTDRIMLNGLWSLKHCNPSGSSVYIVNGNNPDHANYEQLDNRLHDLCNSTDNFRYASTIRETKEIIEEIHREFQRRTDIIERDPDATFPPIILATFNHSSLMNKFSANTTFRYHKTASEETVRKRTEDLEYEQRRSLRADALAKALGNSSAANIFETIGSTTSSTPVYEDNPSEEIKVSYPEAIADLIADGSTCSIHLMVQARDSRFVIPDYASRNLASTQPDNLFNYQIVSAKNNDDLPERVSVPLDCSSDHLRVYLRITDDESYVIAPYSTPI